MIDKIPTWVPDWAVGVGFLALLYLLMGTVLFVATR